MQRGNVDFQQLRVRRDGRISVAKGSRNKARISFRLGMLVALLIGTFIALALFMSNAAEIRTEKLKLQAHVSEREVAVSDDKSCSNHSAGDLISATDAARVRAGSEMNFGGIFIGQIPTECRASQQFLIRDDGEKLVVQKLIPQTVTVLRD